ncbi:D-TA family PLP-dependent enzyme [Maribacter sp. 2307UL18-2]|uniref:D-TA family PLP-dependent enzyme n=1 Tax=Maribacter sp. 2307UL18-2 TaxID=3386274 RepID=UPI0039BC2D97
MSDLNWFEVSDTSHLISPSLLVYPDLIEQNIAEMKSVVGDVSRLRPHIKTHKTAEIIQLQLREGIRKFKCATIAEAELLGSCGGDEILLAMPLVGANILRFVALTQQFPESNFSTLVDNSGTLEEITTIALEKNIRLQLWMDINVGMNRTGIVPDGKAVALFREIDEHPQLEAMGFHVYDGHIRETDFDRQKEVVDTAYLSVVQLKETIEQQGITVKHIVAGGSPSFPVHAQRANVDVAPGTTLLWDARYGELFPHMNFQPAAILFTRIISKPAPNILCFDLGHKSIAPEMNFPRVRFLNLPDSEQIGQSEEHLVVKVADGSSYEVGQGFYALPMHVCPTVAKYETLQVVKDGSIINQWQVAARNQKITI